MGRFKQEMVDRAENFAHRVLDLADALARQRRSGRIIEQVTGCGSSVGANAYEADEAMSRPDFCKTLGIIVKELNESRFWIRCASKRGWIPAKRLAQLEAEAVELKRIFGTMLARTRRNSDKRSLRTS